MEDNTTKNIWVAQGFRTQTGQAGMWGWFWEKLRKGCGYYQSGWYPALEELSDNWLVFQSNSDSETKFPWITVKRVAPAPGRPHFVSLLCSRKAAPSPPSHHPPSMQPPALHHWFFFFLNGSKKVPLWREWPLGWLRIEKCWIYAINFGSSWRGANVTGSPAASVRGKRWIWNSFWTLLLYPLGQIQFFFF